MRSVVTDVVWMSVGLSVYLSVTIVGCAKTAESIGVPFGMWIWVIQSEETWTREGSRSRKLWHCRHFSVVISLVNAARCSLAAMVLSGGWSLLAAGRVMVGGPWLCVASPAIASERIDCATRSLSLRRSLARPGRLSSHGSLCQWCFQ